MAGIIDKIIEYKAQEVKAARLRRSLSLSVSLAKDIEPPRPFFESLIFPGVRIIAECKQKSPSRGVINSNYDPARLARSYELGGAAAISVLTDGPSFGGDLGHLALAKSVTKLPILRKDFIIDEYQIYEARIAGADSYLLIAGVLDIAQLQYFIEIGRELGMEPLVESHNAKELELALATDARIIGINSRNLGNFAVSLENAADLAKQYSADLTERVLVCESGIHSRQDIGKMVDFGYQVFLVGEVLSSAGDPEEAVRELIGI